MFINIYVNGSIYIVIHYIFVEFLLEIENLYSSFTKEKDLNLKKRGILLQIQRLLARCQELGDEKISIVQQVLIIFTILFSIYNKHFTSIHA